MKNNMTDMMSLDIYLNSLDAENYNKVISLIEEPKITPMPLLSWDIYAAFMARESGRLSREGDIGKVKELSLKFKWNTDVDALFKDEQFEALVITDMDKRILWVNDGFTNMTGYTKRFSLDKTPAFLQGSQTEECAKNRIGNNLKKNKPFREVITNHRKDGTPYTCELKIFPLYSTQSRHYLALENQLIA